MHPYGKPFSMNSTLADLIIHQDTHGNSASSDASDRSDDDDDEIATGKVSPLSGTLPGMDSHPSPCSIAPS